MIIIKNLFLPFTPGNGAKQKLMKNIKVLYLAELNDYFSKWGGVVYESDNPEEGWDGTVNNKKDAISGIYT